MIVRKLADTDGGEAVELAEAKGGAYHGITMKELRAKWNETVRELAKRDISVTNPENALEGALSIRYNKPMQAGTTVFASPTPLFDMLDRVENVGSCAPVSAHPLSQHFTLFRDSSDPARLFVLLFVSLNCSGRQSTLESFREQGIRVNCVSN